VPQSRCTSSPAGVSIFFITPLRFTVASHITRADATAITVAFSRHPSEAGEPAFAFFVIPQRSGGICFCFTTTLRHPQSTV